MGGRSRRARTAITIGAGGRAGSMDDDVDTGQTDAVGMGDTGISRRTMIRRSAIAGGALLWATPVVQTLGNDSAYAWFRGSNNPGGCLCDEKIVTIVPVA